MKISKQARRDAKALFKSCLVDGLLDERRVRQAVAAVIAQKPRGHVQILHHLQRLVKLDLDRRTARVESAVPLAEDLRRSLTGNLARRYGQGVNVAFDTNPALLGGLRVKVGSDVYDGTVKARLEALRQSL